MADPEWAFGLEIDRGYDADGYRRKEACLAVADCPACGKELFLVSDTESWTEGPDGRWESGNIYRNGLGPKLSNRGLVPCLNSARTVGYGGG